MLNRDCQGVVGCRAARIERMIATGLKITNLINLINQKVLGHLRHFEVKHVSCPRLKTIEKIIQVSRTINMFT